MSVALEVSGTDEEFVEGLLCVLGLVEDACVDDVCGVSCAVDDGVVALSWLVVSLVSFSIIWTTVELEVPSSVFLVSSLGCKFLDMVIVATIILKIPPISAIIFCKAVKPVLICLLGSLLGFLDCREYWLDIITPF